MTEVGNLVLNPSASDNARWTFERGTHAGRGSDANGSVPAAAGFVEAEEDTEPGAHRTMTRRRAHVVHVINSIAATGGAEQQLVTNLRSFTDPELRHSLVCLYEVDPSRRDEVPSTVPVVHLYPKGVARPGPWTRARDLIRVLRDLEPDLVHCSLADAALAARFAGRRLRVPVVETLVNIANEKVKSLDNPLAWWKLRAYQVVDTTTMRLVTRFHAISGEVARSWRDTARIADERIAVIPRAVDPADLVPVGGREAARKRILGEMGWAEDTFLVVNIGREAPQKGQRYLIEAMRLVVDRIPTARALVAGTPGSLSDDLRRRVAASGLGDRMRFLGHRRDVVDLLAAADVFAFPSLFEGIGVAMLQAMAAECAVVVTGVPPMSDVVTDRESGLTVPPQDPEALAAAIVELAENAELRVRLGAAAKQVVEQGFRPDRVAAELERLYHEVLGR